MNTTKTIAKINEVNILLIDNGEKFVPIRPICQALGIDEDTQRRKINNDEILSSTATLRVAVGADEKEREMFTLPFMFVFGWLFSINPKNVKPEAKEAVIKYKLQCYKALFQHFTDQSQFLEEKQILIEKHVDEVEQIRNDFKETQAKLKDARKMLTLVRETSFDEWKANNRQLVLDLN